MLDTPAISKAVGKARDRLLDSQQDDGHWHGDLSPSAFSTAISVIGLGISDPVRFDAEVSRGVAWLIATQNDDGGWGDTPISKSNVATTFVSVSALCHAKCETATQIARARRFIESQGGLSAIRDYYKTDQRTSTIPIQTIGALGGQTAWHDVGYLPFEVLLLPEALLNKVRLSLPNFALMVYCALCLIRRSVPSHHPGPITGLTEKLCRGKSFRLLSSWQGANGSFIESVIPTSFVAIAYAMTGRGDDPVWDRCVRFVAGRQAADGSWPQATSLSNWVSCLAVSALHELGVDLTARRFARLAEWFLGNQIHRYEPITQMPGGGWPWGNGGGEIPDADDTAFTLKSLALLGIPPDHAQITEGVEWIWRIQNKDGGIPTFGRGWGYLPYDRSAPDITAHALDGLLRCGVPPDGARLRRAVTWLFGNQSAAGAWEPLWMGNELLPDEHNLLYGTAQVLEVLPRIGRSESAPANAAVTWILANQNHDGGWGSRRDAGVPSTAEETAWAVQGLLATGNLPFDHPAIVQGTQWLIANQRPDGTWDHAPVGSYFPNLWYYEESYSLIFPLLALARLRKRMAGDCRS